LPAPCNRAATQFEARARKLLCAQASPRRAEVPNRFARPPQFMLADSGRRCQFLPVAASRDGKKQEKTRRTNSRKGKGRCDRAGDRFRCTGSRPPHRATQPVGARLSAVRRHPARLQTEARQSGYGKLPLGQNIFAVATCKDTHDFRGRIARAREAGPVDLEFGWSGDFADRKRDLRIRVQSTRQGGV
jgi:hypothetical protein